MIVATGDRARGYGPITRGVTDCQRQHERRDQAECMIGARSLDGPVERGAEVVDLGRDDLGPIELVSAPEVGPGGLGELDVMIGVAAPDRPGVTIVL